MSQWSVIREPADGIAEVRVSIGRPRGFDGGYIVFRGDPEKAIDILIKGAEALLEATQRGEIEDKRGRPQG